MAMKEIMHKHGFHAVILVLAVITTFYSCNLLVRASLESPFFIMHRHWDLVWPWGVLQFFIFLPYYYLAFQAAARSRLFAILVLLPLLLDVTFYGFLQREHHWVEYKTIVIAAFSTTTEQMGEYADPRLFAAWAFDIIAVLAFVFYFYKKIWKDKKPHALPWFAAWCGSIAVMHLSISCHDTAIPNARFFLSQYATQEAKPRAWLGMDIVNSGDPMHNPQFREISDRLKFSNVYLPYLRFKYWGDVFMEIYFPDPVENPAGRESTMEPVEGNLCVVLYIGESFRHDHTPFSGYHRNTLPLVSKRMDNIIVFPNVVSYGSHTLEGICGILTGANNESRQIRNASFMHIFKKHNYHCLMSDGATDGAPCFTALRVRPLIQGSYDEMLQCKGEAEYQAMVRERLGHYRLNMMIIEDGSGHLPYKEATGKIWGDSVIDRYDEARLTTDKNLDAVISELEDQPAIILFVSDHGESLGEEGRVGHGSSLQIMEQRHVAAFIWYSDLYKELHPDVIQNLRANADSFTSQENIFHTILSIGGIRSAAQDPELDMTRPAATTDKE